MRSLHGAALEGALDRFREEARERGLALTHQRMVIYQALLEMGEHPSPEDIYERVRKAIPSISLGTVYKNLHTFLGTGLLKEVSLHHGTLRLEANLEPHHHAICTRCKSIFDLPADDVGPVKMKPQVSRSLPAGFRIERVSVEAHGLCAACARKASSSRSAI